MTARPQFLLLCVNYRLPDVTMQFVRHALSLHDGVTCAVADNDGSLPTGAFVDEPRAHVYSHPDNPGYLGGCALALDGWRRAHGALPEWIGIVNTDIEFAPDFFTRLRDLALPDAVAAIAPDIRLPNGMPQNPFMTSRPDRERMAFYRWIFSNDLLFALWDNASYAKRRLVPLLRKHAHGQAGTCAATPSMYAPNGAAIFLRDRFFTHGGSLNFRAFMYQEEVFIAEQLRRMGVSCHYAPQLHITHHESTIISLMGLRTRRLWKLESIQVVLEDYFSPDAQ